MRSSINWIHIYYFNIKNKCVYSKYNIKWVFRYILLHTIYRNWVISCVLQLEYYKECMYVFKWYILICMLCWFGLGINILYKNGGGNRAGAKTVLITKKHGTKCRKLVSSYREPLSAIRPVPRRTMRGIN